MSKYKSPEEIQAEERRGLIKQAYLKPQDIEKRHEKRAKDGYYTIDYYHYNWFSNEVSRIGRYDSRTDTVTNSIGAHLEKPGWLDYRLDDRSIYGVDKEKHPYTENELRQEKSRELVSTLGAAAFLIATGGKHERNLSPRLPAFGALLSSLDPQTAVAVFTQAQNNALGSIQRFSPSKVEEPASTEIGKQIALTFQNLREGDAKTREKSVDAQIREVFSQTKPPFGSGRFFSSIGTGEEQTVGKK